MATTIKLIPNHLSPPCVININNTPVSAKAPLIINEIQVVAHPVERDGSPEEAVFVMMPMYHGFGRNRRQPP